MEEGKLFQYDAAMSFARTVPFYFLGIVGLIYASGFLVVTTHLEALGIRDLGSELWKTRYVHIGVLSLTFPAMIVTTVYGIFAFSDYLKSQSNLGAVFHYLRVTISLFIILIMELTFYSFAMFVRRPSPTIDTCAPHPELVHGGLILMLCVGVVGIAFTSWLERYFNAKNLRGMTLCTLLLRLIILFIVLLCFLEVVVGVEIVWAWFPLKANATESYWTYITGMMQHRLNALLLVLTCWAGVGYYVYIAKRKVPILPAGLRALAWLMIISIAGPMYYLSLMVFAYSLFPYIPATRGGGDYTVNRVATIWIKGRDSLFYNPPSLMTAGVVEETSSTVYVIDENEWHPYSWRNRSQHIPPPTAISRDQIVKIVYPHPDIPDCQASEK